MIEGVKSMRSIYRLCTSTGNIERGIGRVVKLQLGIKNRFVQLRSTITDVVGFRWGGDGSTMMGRTSWDIHDPKSFVGWAKT